VASTSRARVSAGANPVGQEGVEPPAPLARPSDVLASYDRGFVWSPTGDGGLRPPQLGALHATLGYWTTAPTEPATIVMPTGTGKTDTMVALLVAARIERLLVVVPTDALREQIAGKFQTLGVLRDVGVVAGSVRPPVVGRVMHKFASPTEADTFAESTNVIVATPAALSASRTETQQALFDKCSHLFVDEAHHVPAASWNRIRDAFAGKPTVQFTATPYRADGRRLGGRHIYTFPLRQAQALGYYSTLDYLPIRASADPDRAVAETAIARLRSDCAAGLDHLLMARAATIAGAEELHRLYTELCDDMRPQLLHSRVGVRARRSSLEMLTTRESRVVVCVDMLGEGFDLPNLKIAALHDVHRSLGVTLQFIGRFARTSNTVGSATVVAPRPEGQLDENLRALYHEDADWNHLIRDLSSARTLAEEDVDDFEAGFTAQSEELSIRSALPKMSTVVYRTRCENWNLSGLEAMFPAERLISGQMQVNRDWKVVWFVTEERTPVIWTELAAVEDVQHVLYAFYWDQARALLYINCSENTGQYEDQAKALCGDDARLIRGPDVYRSMASIDRRVPTNVGLLDTRSQWRRFSSHAGADVSEGFPVAEAQTKTQTNIFAVGYEAGERASVGASLKGRIWSYKSVPSLKHWVDWCDHIGGQLIDQSINVDSVLASFIRPEVIETWPDLVPLAVEWPEDMQQSSIDDPMLEFGEQREALAMAELSVVEYIPGPPLIQLRTPDWSTQYRLGVDENGITIVCEGQDVVIRRSRGDVEMATLLNRRGFRILLEDDAMIQQPGILLRPRRDLDPFDRDALVALDTTHMNIRKESQGPDRDTSSIQAHAIKALSNGPWEVILDDDGSGEVADIVALRTEGRSLTMRLTHCKYSSKDKPGSRVADLYELCGQAQKSARHRGNTPEMIARLISRERQRLRRGARSGFERGDLDDLYRLSDQASRTLPNLEVVIVQPGLSKSRVSLEVLHLLASTEVYVREVGGASLSVYCSL
jgi:superfamily II DNA or RNA helicase